MAAFNPADLRRRIVEMANTGSSVHIACAFSIVEIVAALYREFLRFPENDPNNINRDFFVLSKGHGVMAQYACLVEKSWIPQSALDHYFSDGSALAGLADSRVPGVEATTGSLGHGMSVAVGLALSAKLRGTDQRTFCLVGDGEINEGPIWEAALFASQHSLANFVLIVDENGLQAMGKTRDILNLGSIAEKFESFGFESRTIDGHNSTLISRALSELVESVNPAPKVLVCKTIKGKGVSFMESNNEWHYTRLTPQLFDAALVEISRAAN